MNNEEEGAGGKAKQIHHPALDEESTEMNKKNMTFLEMVGQAFSLLFQLQKKKGLKRATDSLETNPMSVIIAGLMTTVIFFCICFFASQFALRMLDK